MSWLHPPRSATTVDSGVTELLPVISGDTVESRCVHYRRDCGLPAWVQPEPGRIMLIADATVTTVTMRAELAARVRNRMRHTGMRVGPIALHARSKRWSFLVHPDIGDDITTYASLFRLYVSVARTGTHIALPAPTNRHIRSWVQAPIGSYRPSGRAVIAAVRACTAASHQHRATG